VYNYGNSSKPYDESTHIFTAPFTGLYEFGLFFHGDYRNTIEIDKTTSFGIMLYQNSQFTPKSLFWWERVKGMSSRSVVTTEYLQKGDKVAAGVRGHVRSTDWVGGTDPDGLVATEFWGRLIVATKEPSEILDEVGTAARRPHYETADSLTETACCAHSILDLHSKRRGQQLGENDDADAFCCHDRLLDLMVYL
jgi:hypothetical protein